MDGKELFRDTPDGRKRFRFAANRQVELSVNGELNDVAKKSLFEIASNREHRKSTPLTDDQKLRARIVPELLHEKRHHERKTEPVFHDDLKSKNISTEQMLLIPHIPATNPPDEAMKMMMQSRMKKYPYAKRQIVTTNEMRKPKTSSVGVVPSRSSFEVENINVVLRGKSNAFPYEMDEIELASKAQETSVVPHHHLDDSAVDCMPLKRQVSVPMIDEPFLPPAKVQKPAILASAGTIGSVTMVQRAKPAPKPAVIQIPGTDPYRSFNVHNALKSRRSVQSSLLSEDLVLPNESVYSQYDDAIAAVDADVDTSMSLQPRPTAEFMPVQMKSVKELLDEAKKISSSNAPPLYQSHLKALAFPQRDLNAKTDTGLRKEPLIDNVKVQTEKNVRIQKSRDKRKSISKPPAKVAREEPGTQGDHEPRTRDRSVDEIVAALKQQASSKSLTEADRKIQEIMERVMSRAAIYDTVAVVHSGSEVETEGQLSQISLLDDRSSDTSISTDLEESHREMNIPTLIVEEDKSANIDGKSSDTLAGSSYISTDQTIVQASSLDTFTETMEEVQPEWEDVEIEMEDHLNIQQAWQDLMAPPEATYEDLVSIVGESVDFHSRGIPGPVMEDRPHVHSSSISFLSTWAPTGASFQNNGKEKPTVPEVPTRSIHHFCKMTTEFQLPAEFRNVGRKYHAPDRYSGVFPQQDYRFEETTLQTLEEEQATNDSFGKESRTVRGAAAAHRMVDRANDKSVDSWKAKAEKVLAETGLGISVQKLVPATDESRVYWAPAPPKMEVAPSKVRQLLFPQYQQGEVDEMGRLVQAPPTEPESESDEDEDQLTKAEYVRKEKLQRLVDCKHQSCEDLTQLMKMEIHREEMIRDQQLDKETYRPLVSPPPTPVEETPVDPKAGKDPVTARLTGTRTLRPEIGDGDGTPWKVLGPYDEKLFSPCYFPPPRRTKSLPQLLSEQDDTLIVPLDFNAAMEEIREQRKLIERAKQRHHMEEAEEEMNVVDDVELFGQSPLEESSSPTHADILHISHTPKKEEELTPAEEALRAGRNYVILSRKKKKRPKRPLDFARLEAIEKFLSQPPNKIRQSKSLTRFHRTVENELRVPKKIRDKKGSLLDLLNFDLYKTSKGMPKQVEEREWVREIWNKWFDEVFPPTPDNSEEESVDDVTPMDSYTAVSSVVSKDKRSKESGPEIMSEEIESIDMLTDTEETAEVIAILKEEVAKLTQVIDSMTPPMAFDLARRGALYRKLGMLHKAADDLNRAIKMEPMLLNAYWHRHLLYILQEKKPEALDDLNYIMKHNKKHSGAYRSMAEIYRKQGDITMAIINYTKAIKMNPTDHDAYFQRAEMYEQRGEKLLALEDYSNCKKLMPTRTDAIMKHGLHYFNNQNWTNAINDFTELIRVEPLNATGRLYRGLAYAKNSHWSKAVEDLSAAIHLDPDNWHAFYNRACILRKAHPKRALQDFSVSLLINDSEENIMSYLHRGILYNSQGRPEDAIPDFEAVLKLNKDIACAHVNLGLIYMTKHLNYHRAIKKFTSAIKVDPTYVRAYICRGEAYHKVHDLKMALKDFTRAIHLQPDVHHYYMFRGQLILELGNLDLAAFCVRHAAEIGGEGGSGSSSTFGDRPTQQAAVQSFLKNYDKAIDALVIATCTKPVASLFMLLGKTQMKAKRFKDGAVSFEKALDLMRPWKPRDSWPQEAAEAHFLSGNCNMELRNYNYAINDFNSAIARDPNYAEAYYQRGLAKMNLKQSKGVQDFNRALAIDPNIFQAYLSRACYYGLKGVYTKAILNCNEAIKLKPNSVRAYLYRGALKYHIKAFDLAIRDLTKAASIDSTCPLPYFNRAVCYQESKQHAKALTDYGIVLLLGDQLSLKVLINRGLLYFEQGDFLNALFDFQNAAKLSPQEHCIHHTLGLCFHKLGRLQEAVQTFTKCLHLKPFFLDGLIARGNVYMDYGHTSGTLQARRDYERALRLDPMCLTARVNLAYTLQVCGKLMQAWRNFTIAIELKRNFKPALEARAIVNLQMSNTFAAFQDISASIHVAPSAELLTNRGVINQFMNDRINAMRDYQQAIQMDPKYALAYFNAANIYFHTRHFTRALVFYDKAVEYNPKDESALLNRAITKVLLLDSKSALEDFKNAAALSPHSAHIYFNRANLYTTMGHYKKAEEDYTKALSLQPDEPLTLKRRADVRGKLGMQEEAIADYRRAIDLQNRPHRLVEPESKTVSYQSSSTELQSASECF